MSIQVSRLPSSERSARMHDVGTQATLYPNSVYVLCELDGNVVLCDWDSDAGTLSPRQSIYALPSGVVCSRAHHSGSEPTPPHPQTR